MAQTLVNIRMDEKLKKSMEKTCHELGMTIIAIGKLKIERLSKKLIIYFWI